MCWNADISLNTFIFGIVSLVFIFITNTFTKYKTPTFDRPLMYLFFGSLISMQLFEFFVWRNLKNNKLNMILSKVKSIFVTAQPLILMLMVQNKTVRYSIIGLYSLFIAAYCFYKVNFSPIVFRTSVSNGHLKWEWMDLKGNERINYVIYLAFYMTSLLLLVNKTVLQIFGIFSLLFSIFFYYKDGTFGSMWCWLINLLFFYFLTNILIVQPFNEYNALC